MLPVFFLFFSFLDFPKEGKTNLTEELEAPGKGQAFLCLFYVQRGGVKGAGGSLKSKGLFSFQIIQALPISLWSPLLPSRSLPQVQTDEGEGGCRAVNPTEWLPLSGQELSRKSFQGPKDCGELWVLISLHPGSIKKAVDESYLGHIIFHQ